MQKIDLDIRIFEGFGQVNFGFRTNELLDMLGKADSIEEITDDDDDEKTIMYTYQRILTSFFISGEGEKMILTSCDTEHPDTMLFGQKVFEMNEAAIVKVFADKGITTYESATEEWGETRLSFPELLLDFYMEKDKVQSVTWGYRFDEE